MTAAKTELEAKAHEGELARSAAAAAALRHEQETQSLQAHAEWMREEATRRQEQHQQERGALQRQVLELQAQTQQLQLALAKAEQGCQAAQAEAARYKAADAVCIQGWLCHLVHTLFKIMHTCKNTSPSPKWLQTVV